MLKRVLSKKIGISPKLAATNIVVVAGAFIWYFLAYNIIRDLTTSLGASDFEQLEIFGANCLGIAVSAMLGSLAVDKFRKRTPFLSLWMLAGVFVSLILPFLSSSSVGELIAVSAIFGVYFGLGMPAAMGYFAASTSTGNRATLGGFTFLAIGMSFFILGNVGMGNTVIVSAILAAIRLMGLLLFFSLKAKEEPSQELGRITYKSIAVNRSFILYLIPWIMFNAVDYLTIPATIDVTSNLVSGGGEGFVRLSEVFENLLIAVFAIVTGFVADAIGRKRLAILGFAILGIGYASLSFFPNIYGWYFYIIVDGTAWGILNVIFLFTLWGDIAQGHNSEKFYVFGALPYLFSNFMFLLVSPFISILHTQIFTFASFFLFLAVLPLVYAPETLPEKEMKKRELKIYVEKAQEIAQKYH